MLEKRAMPPHDPFGFSGCLVDSQIQVGEPVGEGGFSVVYRANHLGLSEPVALKCLKMPAGLGAKMSDGIVERFRAESRISYRLSQGNLDIVRSISSGAAQAPATGELVPYIALEWLEGPSLAQDLKRRRAAGLTGRPLAEVIEVLDPAAVALDYAHKQGVVHRDVKPGNLVLAKTRDGVSRIKVLDFGLAKVIDPEGLGLVATSHTVASVILCSPGYGAPEQFDSTRGPVGNYTDVYSFALIVLEMLRDERIRTSISVAVAAQQALSRKPISALELHLPVTPAIDALFQRALHPDGSGRPKDMGEFWNELKRLASAPVSVSVVASGSAVAPSPLGFTAPEVLPWSENNVTRPMKRPTTGEIPVRLLAAEAPASQAGLGFGATVPDNGQQADAGRPAGQGTMIMVQRPPTPQPMRQELGPITAPMPAISRPTAPNPPPPSAELPITRVGEPIMAPLAPVNAPPPAAVAPRPSNPPGASPPGRSKLMVAVLVILSLLVFSSLVVSAGYLAHSWFAARRGAAE
jgi:serine/threonine protein kinase